MADTLTTAQFLAADGVEGWDVVDGWACTHVATGSFDVGVQLVVRVGELADGMDHHPDVDLRYPGVTIRVQSHDVGGLTDRDVRLAAAITAEAGERGLDLDPSEAIPPR